jgi:hypothetical protein
MSVSIDVLAPQKSHIDLSDKMLPSDFGLDDYQLSNYWNCTWSNHLGCLWR